MRGAHRLALNDGKTSSDAIGTELLPTRDLCLANWAIDAGCVASCWHELSSFARFAGVHPCDRGNKPNLAICARNRPYLTELAG